MKRLMSLALLLAALTLVVTAGAFAGGGGNDQKGHDDEHGQVGSGHDDEGDGQGGDDQDGKGKGNRFGPYTIVTTDNGSCGNPWATDTIRRTYSVQRSKNGTFSVYESDRGTFVTIGGVSPGACDETGSRPAQPAGSQHHGHIVAPGVRGFMSGYLAGTVTCTGPCTFNAAGAAACGTTTATTPCYRDVFIAAAFGPTARFSCLEGTDPCSFRFEYFAPDQGLIYHHWVDEGTATTERFYGDIANA